MKDYIDDKADKGRGNTSYLSSTICNEIINIIGCEMKRMIIEEIKESKFYSLGIDSTTDKSKKEQVIIIVRYICPTKNSC